MIMLGNRLKKIIKESGMTIVEFSQKTGVSKNSVINYRDEKRSPDTNFIVAVCLNFGVSPEWLLFGRGETYKKSDKSMLSDEEKDRLKIEDSIDLYNGTNNINNLKNLREEIFLWNHYGKWVIKFIDDAILESGIVPEKLDKLTKNRLIAVIKDELEIKLKARVIDFLRQFETQNSK